MISIKFLRRFAHLEERLGPRVDGSRMPLPIPAQWWIIIFSEAIGRYRPPENLRDIAGRIALPQHKSSSPGHQVGDILPVKKKQRADASTSDKRDEPTWWSNQQSPQPTPQPQPPSLKKAG